MFGLNRPRPVLRADHQADAQLIPATPLTVRLRHIDTELAKLSTQQPRTPAVWKKIDNGLDRRFELRNTAAPATPERRYCERCEGEVLPGQPFRFEPGTGGLAVHSECGGGEGGSR